jgi:triphosphoribosyl-dephospho-CoA synthase
MNTSLTELIRLACLWEATIPKPGNVHPDASFDDLTYDDFVHSAEAIAPILGTSENKRVGELVLHAAQATMKAVGKNTNLGIILILAPLAVAKRQSKPVDTVLEQLGVQDAIDVYQAIRVMQPGGMGKVPEQDVSDIPTITLLDAMRLAEDRDLIARQYSIGYHDVQQLLLPHLKQKYLHFSLDHECINVHASLVLSVQSAFLTGIAEMGETLIRRKCGEAVEKTAQLHARQILQSGWPRTEHGLDLFQQFDTWLRADGHRRNPGTMADLIAATLFLALEEGVIPPIAP